MYQDYLCEPCNSQKHQFNFLKNDPNHESKEEEIECYYCLKKYDEHVQAQLLFKGKPCCLNCKTKDNIQIQITQHQINDTPEQQIFMQQQQQQQRYHQTSIGNYRQQSMGMISPQIQNFTPGNQNQSVVQHRIQRSKQNSISNQHRYQHSQGQDFQDDQLLNVQNIQNRPRLSTQQNNNRQQYTQQPIEDTFQQLTPINEQNNIEQFNNKYHSHNHHRSQTQQSANQLGQQGLLNRLKQNQNQNQSQIPMFQSPNQHIVEELKVNKAKTSEKRVINLLQEYKENGTKFLQKKCIFKYSDYKSKGLISSKFHDKCDKKPHLIILIQSTSGFIFGAYLSEQFDKKNKHSSVNDKQAVCFSSYGKKPVFYPVNNNKILLSEYGIQIGKPESIFLNFDQINQSKCSFPMVFDNPLGEEQTFKFQWNSPWDSLVQDIFVFKQ